MNVVVCYGGVRTLGVASSGFIDMLLTTSRDANEKAKDPNVVGTGGVVTVGFAEGAKPDVGGVSTNEAVPRGGDAKEVATTAGPVGGGIDAVGGVTTNDNAPNADVSDRLVRSGSAAIGRSVVRVTTQVAP